MKRIKLLGLLAMLCLTSCGKAGPYGKYTFRLGKTDGSHFGLSVELKKDDYTAHEGMKQMQLGAELGDDFSVSKIIEQYEEKYPIIALLLEDIIAKIEESDLSSIDGYYQITNYKNEKYGNRVIIGSDFITEFIKENFPEIETLDIPLTPEMLEKFVCAYCDNKTFTFQIPVSIKDLQQQLVWYGYYFDFDNTAYPFVQLDIDDMPGYHDENRYGTHPGLEKNNKGELILDQVAVMNDTFKYKFSHTVMYSEDNYVIGTFVEQTNKDGDKVLYFSPVKEDTSLTDITGYVKVRDALGEFDTKKDMKISVAANSHEVSVDYNHKEGDEEGFTDANGTEFTFKELMQNPFVFRDYHDVKVGLSKD